MKGRLALAIAAVLATAAPSFAASCYVSEFPASAPFGLQVANQPGITDQAPIAVTASAASSAAFSGDTHLVRLHCDTVVSFLFGTAPTATTSNARLGGSSSEYFVVRPGDKVSVIQNN